MSPPRPTTIDPAIFWAKWDAPKTGSPTYHPLPCHLIDVAMVMQVLWDDVFPAGWKQHLADEMGISIKACERWLIYLAGTHDLGKASPGFQTQLWERYPESHAIVSARLTAARLPHSEAAWLAHGMVSDLALLPILTQQFGFKRQIAVTLATAIGGHHGVFFTQHDKRSAKDASTGKRGWDAAREQLALQLAELVEVPTEIPATLPLATAMVIAGAISVADWIGSMSPPFAHMAPDARVVPDIDYVQYREASRQRARHIVRDIGWGRWSTDAPASMAQLFPFITELRPLQEMALRLAASLYGPGIAIVEGPPGEGKSEVAMFLADTWNFVMGLCGIYFALPTQATSNSMYERIEGYLNQRFPKMATPLHLLHGRAMLVNAFQIAIDHGRESQLLPQGVDVQVGTSPRGHTLAGSVIAAEWFTRSKRALLAPFGVGTIDQILLAALQIKHGFVRHFALSTKTVVIDEVHAYDTYMTTLLERLLTWLGALGTPVVLLSATLPVARRQALLAAYASGAGWPRPMPTVQQRYPRVSFVDQLGARVEHFPADAKRRKVIALRWLPDHPDAVIEKLNTIWQKGGCVAIICSTVRRAQAMALALRARYPGLADDGEPLVDLYNVRRKGPDDGEPLVDLFHAQFPFEERSASEQRAVRRFGKDGQRPTRAILVATQVIEQSLDLDFDVMFSDIAPIDLLLQRVGRLHRHARTNRPSPLCLPQFYILGKPTDPGPPQFDRGISMVYPPHLLLRTWLKLADTDHVTLPDDIEDLVEWVYGETACPDGVADDIQAYWRETAALLAAQIATEAQEARDRYISDPHKAESLVEVMHNPREEEAPDLHPKLQALTRLGDLSVEVICLSGTSAETRLRPGGPHISLSKKPALQQVAQLLGRSLRISQPGLTQVLLDQEVPPAWQDIAALCRARPLFFGPDGYAVINNSTLIGKFRLRLDPELGLVIERDTPVQDS